MGYTHYHTQTRDFTVAEWAEVCEDVTTLLGHIQHRCEVQLGDGMGDRGTKPEITADVIRFNGIGDDSHETFAIERKRTKDEWGGRKGSGFTKTARKPYDLAVVAVLCYMGSVREAMVTTSDGFGYNFVQGLEAARQALPRYANVLDIPMDVMKSDRWISPWTNVKTPSYTFDFCVDGRAYLSRVKTGQTYCFPTHHEAAEWAAKFSEPFNSYYHFSESSARLFGGSGRYDQKRHASIARQQAKVIGEMIDYGPIYDPERATMKPPAFVRPGSLPLMTDEARRSAPYSVADLLKVAEAA